MTGLTLSAAIALLLGAPAGAIIAWLWAKARHAGDRATTNSRLAEQQARHAEEKAAAAARHAEEQTIAAARHAAEQTRHAEEKATTTTRLELALAANRALEEKLQGQAQTLEALNRKFSTEFENLANRILETKAERFTQLNKTNLENLLTPLGRSINDFRDLVTKVYDTESKERFSLGEKVKDLAQLNHQLSEDAKNLTRALKGEAKTQGRWGEVILESILERSGLRKGEEFFMEYQLYAADGRPLRSEAKGSRMRPDALIKYPDDRHVIIDAKVSLNAFVRFVESPDPEMQKGELQSHVRAIKDHIGDLSTKAYDDYHKTLDFVMLFIPSEAAYIAALQGDPELWNYAYDRRILLINPSNLIVSLKLIVDLWKREYQNLNAQAIADRGARLYDKFTGFVKNLQSIGQSLDAAQSAYTDAFRQLSTGKDNLVAQATKLKNLGIKTKGDLPPSLLNEAAAEEE